jgi:cell wall-associated NlpC family hydrolase
MSRILLFLLLSLLPLSSRAGALPERWGTAREPVPVFSVQSHPALLARRDDSALPRDRCGQVRSLEFIALPATPFRLHDCRRDGATTICRVTTDAYAAPAGKDLYLDASLLSLVREQPTARRSALPSREVLLRRLAERVGTPYVWGGNVRPGVRSTTGYAFRGLDCSGLLYEASDGFTPRNTSELVRFGKGLRVAGLSAAELAARLQPLDLLVWDGHVIIVLDGGRTVESRLECGAAGHGGVVIRPLAETLSRLLAERGAVDEWPAGGGKFFTVRRWYGNP